MAQWRAIAEEGAETELLQKLLNRWEQKEANGQPTVNRR